MHRCRVVHGRTRTASLSAIQSGLCGVSPQRPTNVLRIKPDTLYRVLFRDSNRTTTHEYPQKVRIISTDDFAVSVWVEIKASYLN